MLKRRYLFLSNVCLMGVASHSYAYVLWVSLQEIEVAERVSFIINQNITILK